MLTPPPPRRRGARVVLVTFVLLLAVGQVATTSAVLLEVRSRLRAPIPPAAAAPTVDPTIPADPRLAPIQKMLDARAATVLAHDVDGWVADIDPSAKAFAAEQRELFGRLQLLPLTRWSYSVTYVGVGIGRLPAALDPAAVAVEVDLVYRLGTTNPTTTRSRSFFVMRRGPTWTIFTDRDGYGEHFRDDLWDVRPIEVVHGRRSLVIGATSRKKYLRSYADAADRAAVKVDAVLGSTWPRTVTVIAPATTLDTARLLQEDSVPDAIDQIAAYAADAAEFSSGFEDTGRNIEGHEYRIWLNPEAMDETDLFGRRALFTHETVHVAARYLERRYLPTWMEEGYADWVAYRGLGLSRRTIVGPDAIRGGAPTHLPSAEDFDAGSTEIDPAYGQAWLAMDLIADDRGDAAVSRFFRTAGGIPADSSMYTSDLWPTRGDVAGAFATIGTTEPVFTRTWRAALNDL